MSAGDELSNIESTLDQTKLKAKASVDNELLGALTSEDGPMRPGALPQVKTQAPGAAKRLYDAMGEAGQKLNLDSTSTPFISIVGFSLKRQP